MARDFGRSNLPARMFKHNIDDRVVFLIPQEAELLIEQKRIDFLREGLEPVVSVRNCGQKRALPHSVSPMQQVAAASFDPEVAVLMSVALGLVHRPVSARLQQRLQLALLFPRAIRIAICTLPKTRCKLMHGAFCQQGHRNALPSLSLLSLCLSLSRLLSRFVGAGRVDRTPCKSEGNCTRSILSLSLSLSLSFALIGQRRFHHLLITLT